MLADNIFLLVFCSEIQYAKRCVKKI